MNIEHLKLFVRIANTHNISMAGHELGLSPAVASSHINKLEHDLGVKLIYRTTRKVSLTEEGIAFLPHAEEVLSRVDMARAAVGSSSISPQGKLRVAAPASFARMHIIPALPKFYQAYPQLVIDLRLSDSIIDMVEGGFDVAIRNAKLNDSTLIAKKIAQDQRVICASPDYLQQYGCPKTPLELQKHRCITLGNNDTWLFEKNNQIQKIKVPSIFKCDNGEAIRDAAIAGLGITICSIWCGYNAFEKGLLKPVEMSPPLLSDTAIWAVYPSSRLLAPKVRAFIDFFSDYFGEIPYWQQVFDSISFT